MKVYLTNFRQDIQGVNNLAFLVYADLRSVDDGSLVIAGTLTYIAGAIAARSYVLVHVNDVPLTNRL